MSLGVIATVTVTSTRLDGRLRLAVRTAPHSTWDYKYKKVGAAPYGNFNFGATAGATGMSLNETLNWGAFAQDVTDGAGGKWPDGDNPGDPQVITAGYQYFKKGCYK